jgi:hypothetical protein
MCDWQLGMKYHSLLPSSEHSRYTLLLFHITKQDRNCKEAGTLFTCVLFFMTSMHPDRIPIVVCLAWENTSVFFSSFTTTSLCPGVVITCSAFQSACTILVSSNSNTVSFAIGFVGTPSQRFLSLQETPCQYRLDPSHSGGTPRYPALT